MKKLLSILFIPFVLIACGGGSDKSSDGNNNGNVTTGDNIKSVVLSGVDTTVSVNENEVFNISIDGIGNVITISSGSKIKNLEVTGNENQIFILENTTIETLTLVGIDNTVFIPLGSQISISSDSGIGNELKTREKYSIIGTWQYTYSGSEQCVETFQFNDDGTFEENSLDEVVKGSYTFEDTAVTGERHLLSMTFTSDNGMPDCKGSSEDDTGLKVTLYSNFTSETVIEWFEESKGGSSIVVLIKQ